MNAAESIVAIDGGTDSLRVVRVRLGGARPEICDAVEVPAAETIPAEFGGGGTAVVAVPDDLAVTRYLVIPDGVPDRPERTRFELTASLTGPEAEYVTDILPTGLEGLSIGLAVRRRTLEDLPFFLLQAGDHIVMPTRATVRGVALARGYLAFCAPAAAGLVILCDLSRELCPVALVHNRNIVALAHLPIGNFDRTAPADCERFAIELKTLVNFRLSTLFRHGLTLPPAAVAVVGLADDDTLERALERFFAMPIVPLEINDGFLADRLHQGPPSGRFLVAAGLAANSLA